MNVETIRHRANKEAHGAIMFVSWAFFLPIGIFLPAFYKKYGILWFRLHILVQTFAVSLAIIGFIVALHFITIEGTPHFDGAHQRLGLATMIILAITPLLGAQVWLRAWAQSLLTLSFAG